MNDIRRLTISLAIWVLIVLPSIAHGTPARRTKPDQDLRNLALALESHRTNKPLQSAHFEANGPARTWRVEILGRLDMQSLREDYRDSEPWNGPHNGLFANSPPWIYSGSLDRSAPWFSYVPHEPWHNRTCYAAVVDTSTVWSGQQTFQSIRYRGDGLRSTVLMIEAPDANIPWLEPRDLDLAHAIALLSTPLVYRDYIDRLFWVEELQVTRPFRYVAFCDASVREVPTCNPEFAKAILTCNGRESVDLDDQVNYVVQPPEVSRQRIRLFIKWDRVAGAGFLLIGMIACGIWFWRDVKSKAQPIDQDAPVGPMNSLE